MRIAKYLSVMALAAFLVALPLTATAAEPVFISVGIAPPPLPVYAQPVCPSPGYLWTPGYWGWGDDGYYWVPGTWVQPPTVGLLWTPGYWGWSGGAYIFNAGYWGPTVGFYGGINYGFGYVGTGFFGGEWRGGSFFYNSAAWHVGGGWHNTYVNNTYIHNTTIINNHTSFNGGNGGINARPTPEQERYAHQSHPGPTAMQTQHINEAAKNPQLRLANNQGKPPIAATAKPASFSGPGVTRASNAGGKIAPETLHATAANAKPGMARPGATNAGNKPEVNRGNTTANKPEVNRGNTMANRNNAMENNHNTTANKPEVNRGNTMANRNNAMENNRNTMANKPEVNRGNTMENRNNSMGSRPPAAQPNTMRSTPPRENMARPSQPAPAEHMSQPRPAPQSHPAPMAHPAPAPHAAPHPAPAEHEGGGEKHR